MKYLPLYLIFSVMIVACSENSKQNSESEKSSSEGKSAEETPDSELDEGFSDTILVIKSASLSPQDYERFKLGQGLVEVWLNDQKVDAGTYRINDATLKFDLLSQTNPVEYQWSSQSENLIVLKQLNTNQELICELEISSHSIN